MKNTDNTAQQINAADIQPHRVKLDINGNPRYVVSFLALGLPTYESTAKTRAAGLKKYRGKDFAGGFVFSSFSVDNDLREILKTLHD